MTIRQSAFKKSPVALGVLALLSAASMPSNAVSWKWGDADIKFDSTFTFATSIRMEDRDYRLIGNSNHPQFDWTGYNAATNVIYQNIDVWSLANGAHSSNGDLGNLRHDPGEAYSTILSGTHELDVNFGNMGFFARGFWFYDFEQSDGDRPYANPITGVSNNPCDTSSMAEDLLCSDIRLYDAFFYADWWVGDKPLTVKIGRQVISWGESTFIQHGINTTNPVDVTRARAPGAELRDIFIPVGMVYASLGLTETLSISGYYQYEWERSWLPVPGSYFAGNDFAGDGGQANNIQLGFTGNPDIDLDHLLASLNGLGNALRNGADAGQIANAYLAYPTKVAIRGFEDQAHNDADDQGQFGLRLTWFAEEFNNTEFSFYHINYHSQRPLISGQTSDFRSGFDANGNPIGVTADVLFMAQNEITRDNITQLDAFTESQFFYPEDIGLWGVSFNTNFGNTAFAGEFAYRVDEPLQIDDVELLYMAMPEQLANVGARPDLAGISQLNNNIGDGINRAVGPGESAQGFIFSDTWQTQFTVSHVFGPALGTDNLILVGEAGYVNIMDMPDPNILRLNAPGTGRTPSLEPTPDGNPRTGLHTGLSNGPETNPFATDSAWGYRLLARAEWNSVFAGVNLFARATFSHDVNGTTPDPLFLFIEDRKSADISFTFDYLSKWEATIGYSAFWGGIGTTNDLSDRDFLSFNIRYAI